ncbi:molybdenum cofactor guanylyltransferase [Desulfosediminicola flagellatus]|uniref:molybdenum cofactor guanylyltransferase n=1 Tax=Desulfosediminicola flagellatus TaxID=2569541 RepID=UPI0010AD26FA|nr:molybdenum cofactor guanylyltransferase [Desulfosediminicola flagellatus]
MADAANEKNDDIAVWACILIGGKSSRMGQPKHLLADKTGLSWLERTVAVVKPHVAGIALSGSGDVPASLASHTRLEDVSGVYGPLTGILSAMRFKPNVAWLLLACDMPSINKESIAWLLSQRKFGSWGTVPSVMGNRVEPLFALYEPQAKELFETMRAESNLRISSVAQSDKIQILSVPPELQLAWNNVNTPGELDVLNI